MQLELQCEQTHKISCLRVFNIAISSVMVKLVRGDLMHLV